MLTTPANYRIRVQGQLGPDWTAFFGGLTLSWQEPDQTVLVGQVVDQSALHGLLNTIRDLGLPLVEVLRLGPEESGAVDPWVPPGPALGCAVLRQRGEPGVPGNGLARRDPARSSSLEWIDQSLQSGSLSS